MPLLTFYAFAGFRNSKIPILTLERFPSDWFELKSVLLEVARKLFMDYGVAEAQLSMEKHLPGRKVWRPRIGSYIPSPFGFRRGFEAYFKITYNPTADALTVSQATFNVQLMSLANDYLAYEKGVKYRVSPLIPKAHKTLLEKPEAVLEELSTIRYPDYSRTAKLKYYAENDPQVHSHFRTYLSLGEKLHENR